MKQPDFDIDIDKHYNATVVIACHSCGKETRHHLKALGPDHAISCQCGADLSMTAGHLQQAQRRASEIRQAYRIS